ncbi:MAG: hypothetical protein ACLGGV_04295 [Bacteroidia bacterium]
MNKYKIIVTTCVVAISTMLVWTGCKKQQSLPQETITETLNNKNNSADAEQTAKIQRFTRALSILVRNDVEVRHMIKSEALKEFDGDYDILFKNVSDYTFSDNQTFKDKLSKIESKAFFENLITDIPALNISVPVKIEDWDAETFIPTVAFVSGISKHGNHAITGYEKSGRTINLNSAEEPNVPVIAVTLNERVDKNGMVRPEVTDAIANGAGWVFCPNCVIIIIGGGGSGGGGGGGGGGTGTIRKDGHSEYLFQINAPDLGKFESWINGKPEIYVKIKSASGADIGELFFNPKRDEIDNTWYKVNMFITTWDFATFGSYINYYWWEDDKAGEPVKYTYTTTFDNQTLNVEYTLKEDDDRLGYLNVTKLDKIEQIYNTGLIKWQMK